MYRESYREYEYRSQGVKVKKSKDTHISKGGIQRPVRKAVT